MKGFLPTKVPSRSYSIDSESCSRIHEICNNLPKLLLTGQVQGTIKKLSKDDLSIDELLVTQVSQDLKLAMSHLSFIAHAYIWGEKSPNDKLPEVLAAPWAKAAKHQGEFNNEPQYYRGETGAQSSIIPSLDGALQITHTKDHLRHYLNEMKDYMPPKHREFIASLKKKSQVKKLIADSEQLTASYNECLEEIRIFRSMHLEYAGTYIHKQAQIKNPFGRGGSTITGTGGTPFMSHLKKHRDETEKQKNNFVLFGVRGELSFNKPFMNLLGRVKFLHSKFLVLKDQCLGFYSQVMIGVTIPGFTLWN